MHRGAARVPSIAQTYARHSGCGDGLGPHLGQRVGVIRLPGFVADHVAEVGVGGAGHQLFGGLTFLRRFQLDQKRVGDRQRPR